MKKNNLPAAASFIVLAGVIAAFFLLKNKKKQFPELSTAKVDLERYLGKWYDIAHLPAFFLNGCFNTQAEYSLNDDGTIKVVNSCTKDSVHGKIDRVEGIATIVDKEKNSKLKVEFLWPFKGDYWIIEVGDQYDYALVGEPSRKYLWILGRQSRLDERIMKRLIDSANEKGFTTNNMILTRHHV
jgi:apolipoprotein D and lipocalin family protein